MSDENTNEPTSGDPGPPPPPEAPTPPPVEPEPSASPSDNGGNHNGGNHNGDNHSGDNHSGDNTVMMILSYLYFFCLVPLLVEKDDPEIQWHAKNGLLLLGADIALAVAFTVMSVGLLGCLLAPIWVLLHFGLFVVRIIAIVKGTQGGRLVIPGLSSLADKF